MELAVPVDSLTLLPGNPRMGDIDAVARSYAAFGQRKPVVARRDGDQTVVIAGNHQLQAARQLGWSHIAVLVVDDDDETAAAFALADNRTADLGTYDEQALLAMLGHVDNPDLLMATGYSATDIEDLLGRVTELPPALADPDAVPDSAPAKTVPGDVWLLGPHRVMCGDSTVPTDVGRLMDGGLADCVWTDPPYGVSYVGKTKDALTIQNDSDDTVLAGSFDSILAASKPGAAVYVAAPAGPAGVPFAIELDARGLFRQRLVWVKDRFALGHSDFHYRHEDIYFGYTPGQGRRGRGGAGWYGDSAQDSVLEFPRPSRSDVHPTMKPVALITYCLQQSSIPGHTVLDPFGGSGSTLIACHQTGRTARLMELDPQYVDVICRRYQEATGTMPIAESTGNAHDFTKDLNAKNRKAT